jgi:hypothetical protein
MVMESESSNQRERDSTTTVVLTFVASLVLQNSKIVLIMDSTLGPGRIGAMIHHIASVLL